MRLFFLNIFFVSVMFVPFAQAQGTQDTDVLKDLNLSDGATAPVQKKQVCQAVRPFDPNVSINILPQNIKFKKGIDFYRFPVKVEDDVKKWRKINDIHTFWIPEKHRTNGRSTYSGLSYKVTADRYLRNYDKGGNYRCGFFSDVNLELQFHSKVMFADRISDDKCRYQIYMNYLEDLNEVNQNVIANSFNALKQGEILDMIEYAEGEDFVLYSDRQIEDLEKKQFADLSAVVGAYITATAQQAEDTLNAYDLSEAYIQLQADLDACPKIKYPE